MDIQSLLQTDNSEQIEANNILAAIFCSLASGDDMKGDDEYAISARVDFLRMMVCGFIDREGVVSHPFYDERLGCLSYKTPLELTRESQEGLKKVVAHILKYHHTM